VTKAWPGDEIILQPRQNLIYLFFYFIFFLFTYVLWKDILKEKKVKPVIFG